jgi:hypothetical protein
MSKRAIVRMFMAIEDLYWRMTLVQRLELYKYFRNNNMSICI